LRQIWGGATAVLKIALVGTAAIVVAVAGRSRERFYYHPLLRWYLGVICPLGALIGLALAVGHPTNRLSDAADVLLRVAGAVFTTLLLLQLVWAWRTAGVKVTGAGIRAGRGFKTRFVRWSDIATFRMTHPTALSPTVYAELTSGALVSTGFTQGRKVRWASGASKDAVNILNQELASFKRETEQRA
jgi:hypothetical protein